jgi:hypothetical protein
MRAAGQAESFAVNAERERLRETESLPEWTRARPRSLSQFQQSATSEGGFDAAEKGWLFDRRRLDRRGLDLLAVVDYWPSLPSSLRSILGFTGRGRLSSMSAPLGCSHYPGRAGL